MAVVGDKEVIFTRNTPHYDLALNAIRQLRDKKRLINRQEQSATIRRIQRASTGDSSSKRYIWKRIYDFSRTAAVGFRMAMLEAMGVDQDWWPEVESTENASKTNMRHDSDTPHFEVAKTYDQAMEYWAHYDQLYPHYYIRQKYIETKEGKDVPLDSLMVIFRKNFKEMITITTKVRLLRGADDTNEYDASVHVICTMRAVDDDTNDIDVPAFQKVKVLVSTSDFPDTDEAKKEQEETFKEASESMAEKLKKFDEKPK